MEIEVDQLFNQTRAILGEGPVWHHGKLIWVDIEGQKIFTHDPLAGADEDRAVELPDRVGCAWPCAGSDRLVCGLPGGLFFFDPSSGGLDVIVDPEPDQARTRFNDGKTDPQGRFWAGTMDMEENEALGSLYMLDDHLQLERKWQGVTVSNGLAWDVAAGKFYYIDSPTRRVMAFDFSPVDGGLSNPRVAIEIPEGEGFPDGMTIDKEGNLWIALWGGWGVVKYDPASGERLRKVRLPVAKVTSCVFGGDDLNQLFITSARIGLSEEELAAQPLAGGVFCVRPGAVGFAAVPFAGG